MIEITSNPNEIKAIKEDSIRRFDLFWKQKDNIEMAKYVFENLYESLRELAECIALSDGKKIYSHELTIKYLKEKGSITENDSVLFDDFRKLRNKSKYYGKNISIEKLKESLNDFKRLKSILISKLGVK